MNFKRLTFDNIKFDEMTYDEVADLLTAAHIAAMDTLKELERQNAERFNKTTKTGVRALLRTITPEEKVLCYNATVIEDKKGNISWFNNDEPEITFVNSEGE